MSRTEFAQVYLVFLLLAGFGLGIEYQIRQNSCLREQLESPLAQEVAHKSVELLYIFSAKTLDRKNKPNKKKNGRK